MRASLLALVVAALVAVVLAVDGPSVRDLCNDECPLKAEAGSVANLNVRGELGGATVDGGTITTTTYYKVIFWIKGKTTNNDTCDPGKVNESISMTVPEELPAGSYKTILEVNSSKGDYIGHFEILFQVKDNDNFPDAPFAPIMRERLALRLAPGKKTARKN